MRLAIAICVCLIAISGYSAEPSVAPSPRSVLYLTNGDFVSGELKNADRPATLSWLSPSFTAGFDFATSEVNAVHFPLPEKLPRPVGEYCFELAGGDVLFGAFVGMDAGQFEIDESRVGRLHLARTIVHRFHRWRDGSDVVYLGPNGLAGWREPAPGNGWREEYGQALSDKDNSILIGEFALPTRASIEFEISWKKKPDFVIALGLADNENVFPQPLRFDVRDDDLVAQLETADGLDLASVQKISAGAGRARLNVFLDQEQGRYFVFSASGEQLADLKAPGGKPAGASGIRLVNKRGDLRLERLRISRWTGAPPRNVNTDKLRVHRTDGEVVYGQVRRFDAASRQFVVKGESTEQRVAADQLESAVLWLPADVEPRAVRAVYQDGGQLSGDIVKVENGTMWLTSPGIKEPLKLPLAGLRSLIVLRHEAQPREMPGPYGTLELEGVRLRGRLDDGKEESDASCLVWHPLASATASSLHPGLSGRIIYREPPPKVPVTSSNGSQPARVIANGRVVRQVVPGAMPGAVSGAAQVIDDRAKGSQRSLHLRTGDTIPCEVTAIDEKGVHFKSPVAEATFVPHEKIKAVELASESSSGVKLNKLKRERLLTLPRMQKDSPPTQLIRSKNGDYLRGRVISMDDQKLSVEVRLETRVLPRDRIARIIWLHPDEIGSTATAESPRTESSAVEENGRPKPARAEGKIWVTLTKPTSVDFVDYPLEDCIAFLKDFHNVKITIDSAALADEGVAPDHPITLKVDGATMRSVLERMLEPLKLTYEVGNDALKITRVASAAEGPGAAEKSTTNRGPLPESANATRVQAVRTDGTRLTFLADNLADSTLSGKSDVIGVCRVELKQVDQLLIGGAIERAAALLAYQQFKLQNAVEPKFVQAGDSPDGSSGTESMLVGKPAPEFELPLLAGQKFRLSASKGKVVVLDFWATWCGPCLQSLPQIETAAREFAAQGVELIAVNLEETPKQITSFIERHKLQLTVALDRDGVVGEKYGATAIPQTVIIDRDGKIARLFIGGGPRIGETIREALTSVLAGGETPAAK